MVANVNWRKVEEAYRAGIITVVEIARQAGVDAGNAALDAMQAIGLSGIVLLDVESGAIPLDYVAGFVDACHAGECQVGLYGSRPTLAGTFPEAGVDVWWLAEWVQSGLKLGPAPLNWSMWQYATGPSWDYDVAVDDFPFATLSQ